MCVAVAQLEVGRSGAWRFIGLTSARGRYAGSRIKTLAVVYLTQRRSRDLSELAPTNPHISQTSRAVNPTAISWQIPPIFFGRFYDNALSSAAFESANAAA